mmetsp:Transcript_80135/g.235706  ORF Transcript_80135/g.235706 Transcript_80135/m.235706 type:complete len:221 (+) Transcript_80135:397-1059(+)
MLALGIGWIPMGLELPSGVTARILGIRGRVQAFAKEAIVVEVDHLEAVAADRVHLLVGTAVHAWQDVAPAQAWLPAEALLQQAQHGCLLSVGVWVPWIEARLARSALRVQVQQRGHERLVGMLNRLDSRQRKAWWQGEPARPCGPAATTLSPKILQHGDLSLEFRHAVLQWCSGGPQDGRAEPPACFLFELRRIAHERDGGRRDGRAERLGCPLSLRFQC